MKVSTEAYFYLGWEKNFSTIFWGKKNFPVSTISDTDPDLKTEIGEIGRGGTIFLEHFGGEKIFG